MHDVEDSIWIKIGNQLMNLGSIWKHEQVNDSNGLLGNGVFTKTKSIQFATTFPTIENDLVISI
jgi:hypothetical protein